MSATLPPPPELNWLVKLIGPEMTLRLIELHGGTRVFVPMRAMAHQKLARALSPEAEAALVGSFGGALIRVPLAKAWLAQVYRARGEGVTVIARRLGATETTVGKYSAGPQADIEAA